MNRRGRGFSLIELLGVIAIMAVLAGTATVMLNGGRHRADMQEAIEQIQYVDASVRTLARQSDRPVDLVLQMESGRLSRSNGDGPATLGTLPGDVKIGRIRIGDRAIDFGSQTIAVTMRGSSLSYALRLDGAAGDHQWVFFSGLSGQMTKVSDEDIDEVLQLSPGSAGADAR